MGVHMHRHTHTHTYIHMLCVHLSIKSTEAQTVNFGFFSILLSLIAKENEKDTLRWREVFCIIFFSCLTARHPHKLTLVFDQPQVYLVS